MDKVVLVDIQDNNIGVMEKLEAHRKGLLHRAFSIVLFNDNGEVLLQKRSKEKYHSGGLWTNTCCSHPMPGENITEATRRRLREEMGIDVQPTFAYKFIYKTNLDQDLIEHEYDHVFIGQFNGSPKINPSEVEDWKYVKLDWLKQDMEKNPDKYTYWFRLIINHPDLNSELAPPNL
ncbi:isopentenyl-diphosphate Delta-isomerase [Chryseosolibacter indicus]|uniref:Isopentenyl-diphosphate delta-isomerase n=1 Tax=Chryseosolibacter indicus TaxID=2782351 RepID=A0ABS5VWH2_9BACT|nr:isopentenyl-diphosphate Delta-isomerase [Chryseosolibacter indicus]MBT1705681.1 isopentenyl-diphosphate Delta-isomerase [Chryseosolibacter indicus]